MWKNIVNIFDLKYEEGKNGTHYQWKEAALAEKMGAKKLGFHMEILEPRKFSCPYHFHHSEEELFLAIEGQAMLRQNNQYREMNAGDLIFFTNGPEGVHQFYNHTDKPFKFLALSTMDPFEVCEYPDSGKVNVSAIKKVFLKADAVDYIKGEEDPRKFWPDDLLT